MTEAVIDTNALAAALAEEEGLYSSLLHLTVKEERAIIAGDVEQLTTLVDEKQRLLELIAAQETERMTAITAIAMAVGEDPDTLTLSIIARHAPSSEAGVLMEGGMLLRAQAVALRDANQRNTLLLESSADLVDRWIHYLRTIVGSSLTYTDRGSIEGPSGPRAIDRAA